MIVHICIFICFTGDYFFLLLSHQSYIGIGHTTAINEKKPSSTLFLWFLFYLILLLTPEMYNSTTEHCFSFSHRCAIGFRSMACNPWLTGDRIACTLYNFFQFKTKSKAKKTTTNKQTKKVKGKSNNTPHMSHHTYSTHTRKKQVYHTLTIRSEFVYQLSLSMQII